MNRNITDCATVNNGVKMPWLSFGVFQMNDGAEVETAVRHVLATGYRTMTP